MAKHPENNVCGCGGSGRSSLTGSVPFLSLAEKSNKPEGDRFALAPAIIEALLEPPAANELGRSPS